MKDIFQIALAPDGTGVKKWVDIPRDSYLFHKSMGREVRALLQNKPLPKETLVTKEKDDDHED